MKSRPASALIFSLLLAFSFIDLTAKPIKACSPSGKISVAVESNNEGPILVSAQYDGTQILSPSPIGMEFSSTPGTPAKIKSSRIYNGVKETIKAPFHRNPEFDVEYNRLDIKTTDGNEIEFRLFDDGIAWRFISKDRHPNMVTDETVCFNLPGDPKVFLSHSTNPKEPMAMAFQNFYTATPLSEASSTPAFLPATVDYGNGLKMTILESDLESYPGMFLQADSVGGNLKGVFARYPASVDYYPWRKQEYVTAREDFLARTAGSRSFPWRILAVTDDDTKMPVNNLVYALASPSRIADTSWIKPGKAAWEWWNDWGLRGVPFKAGINNDTYKYFIDFAADNGMEYVVLDEGWYDPGSGDMLNTVPEIDLPMLTAYAEEKGVGLWLWTVFNVLDSQLEEACEKYSKMGIKGLKVDFLDRDDQAAVDMTYRICDAAAKNNLMLDLHGFYKPTGLNRTYPNVVNYEAVFGMEEMKWSDPSVDMPEYDVTFPFIRMMAGPVDFTPGAMRNATKADWKPIYSNPMSQGTRTHQLAHYIVHDSPFSMLADSPSQYLDNKESMDFITSLPSVFDETRILAGEMGEYIVTLRKSDNCWFIGGETDWNPRDFELDFSFLPSDALFKVTLIKDGINADKQAQDYVTESFTADSGRRELIHMAPGGGFVVRIDPLF